MTADRILIVSLALLAPTSILAAEPDIQTPEPVIYLADNLDEPENLGFCPDVMTQVVSEGMQAHSCKPEGGDVQFYLDAATGQIASVAYPGKCLEATSPQQDGRTINLFDCAGDETSQRFIYDSDTMEIRSVDYDDLCMAVGPTTEEAGPFVARDLLLAECTEIDPARLQWVVKGSAATL